MTPEMVVFVLALHDTNDKVHAVLVRQLSAAGGCDRRDGWAKAEKQHY